VAKTLNQVAEDVLDELGEDNTDSSLITQAGKWVQRIYDEIGDELDWRFNYLLDEITTAPTIRTYDLDMDVRDISTARIQDTGEVLDYRSKDVLFSSGYDMESTGIPRFYYHDEFNPTTVTGKIGFYPIPNSIVIVELNCTGRPGVLSNAALGTEAVTDGEFAADLGSWTSTNWTWAASTAQHTPTFITALSQNVTVVKGVTYRIGFDISGRTVGSVAFDVDGESIYLTGATTAFTATGSGNFTAAASGAVLFSITPSVDFDGALDNVSIMSIANIPVPNEFLGLIHEGTLALGHRHEREWDSFEKTYGMYLEHKKKLKRLYMHPKGNVLVLQQTDVPRGHSMGPVRLPPGRYRNW